MGKLSPESLQKELDASLKRLGVEMIDLYQIHWPDPEDEIPEAWKFIQQSIKAGKIRYAGVSNFSVEQMKQIQPLGHISSLQPPYSLLRRTIETDILPFCNKEKIGVVAYSPMVSGLLTGKVTQAWVENLPNDDWRKKFNKEFHQPNLDANISFIEETLRPIANIHQVDPGQIAIAWTLRKPAITSAIVGGRNPQQVEQTVRAASIHLTDEEIAVIETGLEHREKVLT